MTTSTVDRSLEGSVSNEDCWLEYPLDFYNLKTGAGPFDEATAALYWSFRIDRPKTGFIETKTPDGAKMMEEFEVLRISLRESIMDAHMEGARNRARTEI
jgi:hypothetical protein